MDQMLYITSLRSLEHSIRPYFPLWLSEISQFSLLEKTRRKVEKEDRDGEEEEEMVMIMKT